MTSRWIRLYIFNYSRHLQWDWPPRSSLFITKITLITLFVLRLINNCSECLTMPIGIHSKYFAVCDWHQWSLRLNLHNQLTLTIFGRCEQSIRWYTVYLIGQELMDGMFDSKRGCLGNSKPKKRGFKAIWRRNSWISDLNYENMQEYSKHISLRM